MNNLKFVLVMAVLAAFLLSACSSNQPADNGSDNLVVGNEENSGKPAPANTSGNSDQESTDTTAEDSDDQAGRLDEDPKDSGTVESAESPKPAWYQYEFTDATTGEVFVIEDFKGKVVLVETITLRCRNCLTQQEHLKELHILLDEREDFVSVSINIDPEESLEMGAAYFAHNEFDWYYGDAPIEIIADIRASLGNDFVETSFVPVLVIDKEGRPISLPFGLKTADELFSYLAAYLD